MAKCFQLSIYSQLKTISREVFRMQNNEYLAQEALKYLERAQRFEAEGKGQEAIENYQLAADNLKKSGYMMHRVSELYDRIEGLKTFMKDKDERMKERTEEAIAKVKKRISVKNYDF